jgi:hypothetical protein
VSRHGGPPRWLAAFALLAVASVLPACAAYRENTQPMCRYGSPTVLMAQSVPGATLIPCVRRLPPGWHFGGFAAEKGLSEFWLNSDTQGDRALRVVLSAACTRRDARRVTSDEQGTRLYQRPELRQMTFRGQWYYLFGGGCVTYGFTFVQRTTPDTLEMVQQALSFITRRRVAEGYRRHVGPSLDPPASPSQAGA